MTPQSEKEAYGFDGGLMLSRSTGAGLPRVETAVFVMVICGEKSSHLISGLS